jgi:drug/metabolite transporter (DMT)-like permease
MIPALLVVESLHYVFGRLLLPHMPPVTSSFLMMAISTVELYVFARGRIRLAALFRHWVFFSSIGLLVAVNTWMGFAALRFIDPGTASLLARTSILFSLALGLVWLGERLSRVEVAGAGLAIGGVLVVSFQPGDYLRFGALVIVAATFLYALHAAIVKRWGGQIAFLDFFFYRVASTSFFLLLLTVPLGGLVWPGSTGWLIAVLAGTVDVVISRSLYYLALRRLDMSLLTIILTLSPVVTMAWSFALWGRTPSLQEIAGGVAILAGVLIVTTARARLAPTRAT